MSLTPFHLDYIFFVIFCVVVLVGTSASLYFLRKTHLMNWPAVIGLVLALVLGNGWVNSVGNDVKNKEGKVLLGYAHTYASGLQLMGHEEITLDTKPDDPKYLALIEHLKKWVEVNSLVNDIYTFRRSKDGENLLLVDSETDYNRDGKYDGEREVRTAIGEPYDGLGPELDLAFKGQLVFLDEPYTDKWGTWISALVPMRGKNGNVEAVVGVDYSAVSFMSKIKESRQNALFYFASVYLIMLGGYFAYCMVTGSLNETIQAQRALRDAQEAQVRGAKLSALGEMAAGVAHEINNPLAIITCKTSQLIRHLKMPNPNVELMQKELEKIQLTTNRITKIVRGLSTFSRDASKDPFAKVPVAHVVNDTVELCSEKFKKWSVALQVESLPETHFECRPTEISQVLLNLLNNALDAVSQSEGSWVRVEASIGADGENCIEIRVTDSGKGIPENVAEKLMQPFFTTKEPGKGTGLGLSISKGIVESHGGKFWLDRSSPNTSFVLKLPLEQSSSDTGSQASPAAKAA